MTTATPTTAQHLDPADPHGWRKEGRELLAGAAGGALVGMPLLYTMEMWFRGATMSAGHQLVLLGATLAVNFAFCYVSGFRPERGLREAALEAVTAVGIGLVLALIVLALIGEVDPRVSIDEITGKLLIEAAAISLGVSFADAHLRGKSRRSGEEEGGNGGDDSGNQGGQAGGGEQHKDLETAQQEAESRQLREDLLDIAATLIGSVLFALNVAPTEEVVLIAGRLGNWHLLALLGGTIVLCYVILYASGFEEQPVHVKGWLQQPWPETVMAVGTSLLVAFVLLWLLGRPEATSTWAASAASTVTLGLPAAVGGAAGRLVT